MTAMPTTQEPPALPPAGSDARAADCTGTFETHVTVGCAADELPRLERWSEDAGLKLTHIVLARGSRPSQPMLTASDEGTLSEQYVAARHVVGRLRDAGFEAVRVKIEAAPWAGWIPQNEVDAQGHGPERYFEHHIKLRLAADDSLESLASLVTPHHAHVSWNARRALDQSRLHERFVTQRCHGIGLPQATDRLTALVADLRGTGHHIVGVEQEFVVHDSNIAVDDGWITSEVSA